MAQQTETVTCATSGCTNQGLPMIIAYDDEDGPPGVVMCGGCGEPISDIVEGGEPS